ncbi:E3 ubiquitin-protein ligase RNF4 [Xenopus tropicalis]|eukprot:NP_001016554.1 E3 ubiquitin-protein ligase RNF4 [Xenopus tropicalis]
MAQRKRKGAEPGHSKSSKRRAPGSTAAMTAATEPIELESGEEVVDLTCESTEPVVVDLTNNDLSINDSVVIVEDTPRQRRALSRPSQQTTSCVLSSDDEDSRHADHFAANKDISSQAYGSSRSSSGKVSCPICMDSYSEIVQSGRLIVSTKCGHIFCSQCLRDALKNAPSCPTCRKKLNHKQYHPIYV